MSGQMGVFQQPALFRMGARMAEQATILVVDDDLDFVNITRMILESQHYQVITAANGEQGLQVMRREKPDLVILDIMMSYIMDGLDVRRKMAEDGALQHIPVIMVTSLTSTRAQGEMPGHDYIPDSQWLNKPIDPDLLLERVRELLGTGSATA
jgi:DNA-binding response OmpR family regulator